MSALYRLDTALKVVFSRFSGNSTDTELLNFLSHLRQDPDFDSGYSQLIDVRDVVDAVITPAGLRRVAEDSPCGPESKRAIVVDSVTGFNFSRLFEGFSANKPGFVRMFFYVSDALVWLGLSPETEIGVDDDGRDHTAVELPAAVPRPRKTA